MLTILKSLVISTAEYASILWSPTDSTNIQKIEAVQRRFTSKISKFRKYNEELGYTECVVGYADRLKDLKIYSLQRRRERFMLCYMYKLHIGSVPDLGFLSDENRNGPQYLPKSNPVAADDIRAIRTSSFFTQGPLLFNLMPLQLRQASRPTTKEEAKKMFDRFKRRLDAWLELIPDEPYKGKPLKRSADPNSIEAQMRKHGVEVRRQWEHVLRKLEREEANEATARNGRTSDGTTKRKSKFEKQAEESAKRMRNNRSEKWDGWL